MVEKLSKGISFHIRMPAELASSLEQKARHLGISRNELLIKTLSGIPLDETTAKANEADQADQEDKSDRSVLFVRLPKDLAKKLDQEAKGIGITKNDLAVRILSGIPVGSAADWATLKALFKVNGDMGRAGGLLKLWLTNDERTAKFSVGMIIAILHRIDSTRNQICDLISEYMKKFERK